MMTRSFVRIISLCMCLFWLAATPSAMAQSKEVTSNEVTSVVSTTSSVETQLALCPEDSRPEHAASFSKFTRPDGQVRYIVGLPASETLGPDCELLGKVPVSSSDILAASLFPKTSLPKLVPLVLLEGGHDKAGQFVPYGIEPCNDSEGVSQPKPDSAVVKQSKQRLSLPASSTTAARSGWVWQPDFWKSVPAGPQLERLKDWGIKSVYIFIPMDDNASVQSPKELARFIREASNLGIAVYAVDGDPTAIMPRHHKIYVSRTQAYVDYNTAVPRDSRLAGVQYDIEPHSLPGFWLHPESYHANYADLLHKLRSVAVGLQLEIAVPATYLINPEAKGGPFLEQIGGMVDALVVMDYSTDAEKIIAQAEPFLNWGAAAHVPVKIALEAGELDSTELQLFKKSEQGTFWLSDRPDLNAYLGLVLKQNGSMPGGKSYRYVRQISVPASKTTFYGRKDQLKALLPQLESRLNSYSSFAGVALHDILRDEI